MHGLLFDLRYALRGLRRTPAFTVIVLLTLALGIGANSAIFSVVNSVLLKPLPYKDPDRLVTIFHDYPSLKLEAPVTAPGFRDYRDRTTSFEAMAVQSGWGANLTGGTEPVRITANRVTQQFFSVLGVAPAMGRPFLAEEEEPGNDRVVILGHGLWQRLFGGDAGVLGRMVSLNSEQYEVVGVMPRTFLDPWNQEAELWAPLAFTPAQLQSRNEYLMVTARLKPGITVERAQAELDALLEGIRRDDPSQANSFGLLAKPVVKVRTGNIRTALFVLLGAVGFVLLIACANVANLFLVRAAGRHREIAVRTALGAQRWPIIRQLLVESTILSVVGGALGLLIAWMSVRLLIGFNPGNIPRLEELTIDGRVVAFTAIVAVVTGLLFGVFPALRATRSNLHDSLKEGGRSGTGDRGGQLVRRTLVVAEVALALTLLVGGGLLLRSFARLADVDPGFNSRQLLTFAVSLPAAKYPSDTVRRGFLNEALVRLAALPGVQAVGAASVLPFSGGWSTGSFNVEGYQVGDGESSPWGDQRIVSPGYFEAMGTPLLAGRFIDDTDRPGGIRVAVVDDEFVRRFYRSNEDAIGKRFWFGSSTPTDSTLYISIVGVVKHARHEALDAEARVQLNRPFAQAGGLGGPSFVVRTTGDPMRMVPAVRAAIQEIDPDMPLARIRSMEEMIGTSMSQRRLSTILLGIFSGIALLLATLGIYGVMSYTVSQRTRELGIRMALGASREGVLRLVLSQGMMLAIIGVVVGLAGAFALTRVIASQLYDVKPTDPLTFVAVTVLLSSVALVASLIPAMRATRVDPMVALREE
jgi:putative ABC transport system permease protein